MDCERSRYPVHMHLTRGVTGEGIVCMSNPASWPPFAETNDATALSAQMWTHCAVGLCLVGAEGKILRVNPALAKPLGYAGGELQGEPMSILLPENRAWEPGDELDIPVLVHRQGHPVRVRCESQRIADGDVAGSWLLTVAAEGESSFNSLPPDSPRSRELAGVISNNFNNILSIILGYTALLQEGNGASPRMKIVAEGVENAVQRASSLVRQALYLSKQVEPVREKSDLGSFVQERMKRLRAADPERAYELDTSVNADLEAMWFDPQQIEDAVTELIARIQQLDPSAARRVVLRTDRVDGADLVATFPEASESGYARIELRGLEPARRTPSRPPIEPPEPGVRNDLGLVIAERVARSHRGFSSHRESDGGELRYRIYLPLWSEDLEAEPPAPAPPRVVSANRSRKPMLLLIDDELSLLATLTDALQHHGYDVMAAHDGLAGVELFKNHGHNISLVICDLILPQVSGWDIMTKIRELNPTVPVLVMSGHLEPKLESAVARSGAAGFLQKPFSVDTALRRIAHFAGPPQSEPVKR